MSNGLLDTDRRRFVTGLAAGGVLAGLGLHRAALADRPFNHPHTLRGTDFALDIGELPVNFTGRARTATVVNGSLPAPLLRWREGDRVRLRVSNRLREISAIHWHGILLPADMDGVPGLSFAGIRPGESYLYEFDVKQSGTYWYHAHALFQEQTGLYGPLIIDPREPEPFGYEREYVVMLSDWSDMDPQRIFAILKKQSHYFNYDQRTLADFWRDVRREGFAETLRERRMWGAMRMSPTDLADVNGHTYTYLLNGNTPAGNWTGLFRRGERIRLRFINGSAMSYFDVRIPGLRMKVVAADGQNVHPVTVDEFRLPTAETLDVIVTPEPDRAYTIFAQSIDRTGYARGTLAPRLGMEATIPALDKRVVLTMADMGHGHDEGMHHGAQDEHAAHSIQGHDTHIGHEKDHLRTPRPLWSGRHPTSEQGNPAVDMQVMSPQPRLDDPGIGLREAQLRDTRAGHRHGHKVLTMADLRSLFVDPDGREPGRTLELHLTEHMERYIFGFDGLKFSDARPIDFRYGERLRIVLVNDSMMEHPIHLHGMWSDIEDEQGRFMVRKHTVTIPPGTVRSYRVTADALGRWAYHCHLLYHMNAGMFREVRVA